MLGVLTLWGNIQLWHILLLTLIHGISEAADNPARQSLVSDLVDKGAVMNAISLNAASFYGTRLLGPAIGGFLIAAAGTGIGFLINALTFVPYIVALIFINPPRSSRLEGKTWGNFKDGLAYVRTTKVALTILIVVGLISVFMVSYQTLMPIFANDILRVGPKGLGFLSAATGLGAVIGSLLLAFHSHHINRQGRFICLMATAFGLSLLIFSFSKVFWLSLLCLVVAGASSTSFSSSSNAVLQTIVPANLRGRVMGVFTSTSQGSNVFGSLLIGSLGSAFGAPGGLAISSAIAITVAISSFALVAGFRHLRQPTSSGS
jgi:MFS family permease